MAGEEDSTPAAHFSNQPLILRRLVAPINLFADWEFSIPREHWATMDILREERMFDKVPRLVWTQGNPPCYSFQEGDMFYSRDKRELIQVSAARTIDGVRFSRFRLDEMRWAHVSDASAEPHQLADLLRGRSATPSYRAFPSTFTPGRFSIGPYQCRMSYVNDAGEESERDVVIVGAERKSQLRLLLYAIDRSGGTLTKTFRADRVTSLIDLQSGEVLHPILIAWPDR